MREDTEAIAYSDSSAVMWEATCNPGFTLWLEVSYNYSLRNVWPKNPTALVFSLAFPSIWQIELYLLLSDTLGVINELLNVLEWGKQDNLVMIMSGLACSIVTSAPYIQICCSSLINLFTGDVQS